MQIDLPYGKERFNVEVQWGQRKHLCIYVHPDLRVVAKAPNSLNLDFVRKKVAGKASWIAKQINFFEQFQPIQPERKFVSGETHYYLGRQYKLKIKKSTKTHVKLIGRFFEVETPDISDNHKVRKLMQSWYTVHARELFQKRISQKLPVFLKLGAKEPTVQIRKMKRRWGSCSTDGVIKLNTELIKAPVHCIDYVIVHELCHLLCPNHDNHFYSLLSRNQANWKMLKRQLEIAVSKT